MFHTPTPEELTAGAEDRSVSCPRQLPCRGDEQWDKKTGKALEDPLTSAGDALGGHPHWMVFFFFVHKCLPIGPR